MTPERIAELIALGAEVYFGTKERAAEVVGHACDAAAEGEFKTDDPKERRFMRRLCEALQVEFASRTPDHPANNFLDDVDLKPEG